MCMNNKTKNTYFSFIISFLQEYICTMFQKQTFSNISNCGYILVAANDSQLALVLVL